MYELNSNGLAHLLPHERELVVACDEFPMACHKGTIDLDEEDNLWLTANDAFRSTFLIGHPKLIPNELVPPSQVAAARRAKRTTERKRAPRKRRSRVV